MTQTRRQVIGTGILGAASAAFGVRIAGAEPPVIEEVDVAHSSAVQKERMEASIKREVAMQVRYRTDPERIARLLPPPLEPDDDPVVQLDYYVGFSALLSYMDDIAGETTLICGPTYAESDVLISAKFKGFRGLLEHTLFLPRDVGRVWGREKTGLHKKDGWVRIERKGDLVRASTTRRGILINAIETVVTAEPAHPLFWCREIGWGAFQFVHRLHPDWRQGPLRGHPVQLWRVVSLGSVPAYDEGFPTGMPDEAVMKEYADRIPRACDSSRTVVHTGDLSPVNITCELPVREVLGASWFDGSSTAPFNRIPVPRERSLQPIAKPPSPSAVIAEIDPAEFEQWALDHGAYDRPVSDGKVWVPVGWPEKATASKLTTEELARYRTRDALTLEPVKLVDLRLELDPALHARAVPPVCTPGSEPLVRILAIDVERSDLSTRPFIELWLLVRCEVESKPAWYSLAHIVGWDGDVLHGRETFGYPSKLGDPEMTFDGVQYNVLGRRMRRSFFRANLPLAFDPPSAHDDGLEVLGIHLHRTASPPRADLVAQPWQVRLDAARPLDLKHVYVEFPREPAPGKIGLPDPWFEFESGRLVGGFAGTGAVRRLPGRVIGDFPGFEDYYSERFEGSTITSRGTFLEPKAAERILEFIGPQWQVTRQQV